MNFDALHERMLKKLEKILPKDGAQSLHEPHILRARERASLTGRLLHIETAGEEPFNASCLLALLLDAGNGFVHVRRDMVGARVYDSLMRLVGSGFQLEVHAEGCMIPAAGVLEAGRLRFADQDTLTEGAEFTVVGELVMPALDFGSWVRDARGQYHEIWLSQELPALLTRTRDIVCTGAVRLVAGELRKCSVHELVFRKDQQLKELK